MAKKETLRDLFITKVQALYDIESELVEALPTMAEAATEPGLKEAFRMHLDETRGQVARLENIFDLLGEEKETLKVDAIRGLIKDAEWLTKNVAEGDPLDTALIGAARSVEHYEMAAYLAAQEWAELLEDEGVSELLQETFDEEEAAEEKLSEIAIEITERLSESDE